MLQPFAIDPADLTFIAARRFAEAEIARVFGLPRRLLIARPPGFLVPPDFSAELAKFASRPYRARRGSKGGRRYVRRLKAAGVACVSASTIQRP